MIVVSTPDMTPTEHRMLQVLADGRGHAMSELMECLDDPLTGKSVAAQHLSNLRKKLAPQRTTVVSYLENNNLRYRVISIADD